jgi:hypothetical protein
VHERDQDEERAGDNETSTHRLGVSVYRRVLCTIPLGVKNPSLWGLKPSNLLTFFGTTEVVPFQNERSVVAANQGAKRMLQNLCADFVRRLITKIAIGVPGIESSE